MADVQATFFATLIDEWIRCGVTDAVVAPGQRSSLFAAQIEAESRIRTHVMVDERSASFFALGLGIATGRPTLIWCTSGTATTELHPAVVEAHQAQVPLLVCTANRPPELQHSRDWQSIDQSRLYEGVTRWHFEPGVAVEQMASHWRSIAARAVAETMHNPAGPGPVHLDLPIREPWEMSVGELPPGRKHNQPWHGYHKPVLGVAEEVIDALVRPNTRGVITVGRSNVDADTVHRCAEALGWPVLADVRSGCRIQRPNTVSAFEGMLRSAKFAEEYKPEVVLRIGNPSLSTFLPLWLRDSAAEEWLVDPFNVWAGSVPDAAHIVQTDPTALCNVIAKRVGGVATDNEWINNWRRAEVAAQMAIADMAGTDINEPAIGRALTRELPDGANLFTATSMPVRDVEWYGEPRNHLNVYANRGASGMDGLTSTAAAVSFATRKPTVFLVGDLSFLYDLNALWVLKGATEPVNLTIVLVDNNGGGIFSAFPFLTGLGDHVFERVVATPQDVDIPSVAQTLGAHVVTIDKMNELMPAVQSGLEAGGINLVYLQTDRNESAAVRRRIHDAIAQAVA